MQKPDWNVWGAKEKVALWQAPLLSLDRDPDRVNFDSINAFGSRNNGATPQDAGLPPEIDDDFWQRLWLLRKALQSSRKYFPDDVHCGIPMLQDDLPLGAFAAWCELSKLDVPAALAEIGKAYGGVKRLRDDAYERRKGEVIGWHDAKLDAAMYFNIKSVTLREAAMLLCCIHPNKTNDVDALGTTTDETTPDDLRRLLRVFEDEHQAESQARTLRQWHDIAHAKQLRHHSWICRYSEAMGAEEKNANSNAPKAAPAESKPEIDSSAGDRGPALLEGEPPLKPGRNERTKVDAWVKWQAKRLKQDGDTGSTLASRIKSLAETHGRSYESERGPLTVATIIRMLPREITGGRGKNRSKSKE